MDIDAIIAEAVQETAETQPAASLEATPESLTPQEPEVKEEVEDISKKPDSELTPEQLAKRERNRESKLNSKLAEMRRANRELQARLALVNQNQQPPKEQPKEASGKPDINTFQGTYEEFTEASTKWLIANQFTENTKKAQETQQLQDYTKWVDERSDKIDKRLPELSEIIPDISNVLTEVEDLAQSLTPAQARVALEAEDINLAIYTLHKEGKLEEVIKLSPIQLASAIAKAEVRGQQYLTPQKSVTNAPAPLTPSKGNGTTGKSLDRMTADELYDDWFKKK